MPRGRKLKLEELARSQNTTVAKLLQRSIDEQGTIRGAARQLKVSPTTIYELINSRNLVVRRTQEIVPRDSIPNDGA